MGAVGLMDCSHVVVVPPPPLIIVMVHPKVLNALGG